MKLFKTFFLASAVFAATNESTEAEQQLEFESFVDGKIGKDEILLVENRSLIKTVIVVTKML